MILDLADAPEHWASLGDGFRVEARIVLWESGAALQVPTSALFREGDRWAVYVVRGGRAVRRAVTVGKQNGLEAEVVTGLVEGDTVIVHPGDRIDDGVRVTIR